MESISVLQISKISNNLDRSNVVIHSSKLKSSRMYVQFLDVVYLSLPENELPINCLGLNSLQRLKHKLALTDTVQIKEYQNEKIFNKVKQILFSIYLRKSSDEFISHEDELREEIVNNFKKHFFFQNQRLIVTVKRIDIILDVVSKEYGFIDNMTEMQFESQYANISIIKNTYLKRDLFRDNYNFEEIGVGGLNQELIQIFRRALSTRAVNPKLIKDLGIQHTKGILLYGPPGTGKTLIAKRIGYMLSPIEPIIINGPEILNKYVGQSEETLREKFEPAKREYKQKRDASKLYVYIFDEIDALFKTRGRQGAMSNVNDSLVNQFLTMIEGVESLNNIFIIAMTNRKDLLDPALLRAGRIGVHIQIHLPDFEGRKQILKIHTGIMSSSKMLDQINYDTLARLTENFSGAELEAVVNSAATFALHEKLATDDEIDIVTVNEQHFIRAINETVPMFGNCLKDLTKLMPTVYESKPIDNELAIFSEKTNRLNSVIIYGDNYSGKTTCVTNLALNRKTVFTKLVRAIDVINMDEYTRSEHLISIYKDGTLSTESMIIIDDVEIVINYAEISNVVSFSNKLYQTLLTVLKTVPDNPQNKMYVVVTCGNETLYKNLSSSFNVSLRI